MKRRACEASGETHLSDSHFQPSTFGRAHSPAVRTAAVAGTPPPPTTATGGLRRSVGPDAAPVASVIGGMQLAPAVLNS